MTSITGYHYGNSRPSAGLSRRFLPLRDMYGRTKTGTDQIWGLQADS